MLLARDGCSWAGDISAKGSREDAKKMAST